MGQCFSLLQQAVTTLSSAAATATGEPQADNVNDVNNNVNNNGNSSKPTPQYPQIINHAYVSKMPDGDTLTCSYRHPDGTTASVRVRVFAIDCPELAQNFGEEAKTIGQSLLLHKTVTLHTTDVDRYGRLVADVVTDTGINYSHYMLQKGAAWHYTQYDNRAEFKQLELDARNSRIGLWSYARPQPPWEYRRKKRNRIAANKKDKDNN